jgi:hypothetical protein
MAAEELRAYSAPKQNWFIPPWPTLPYWEATMQFRMKQAKRQQKRQGPWLGRSHCLDKILESRLRFARTWCPFLRTYALFVDTWKLSRFSCPVARAKW